MFFFQIDYIYTAGVVSGERGSWIRLRRSTTGGWPSSRLPSSTTLWSSLCAPSSGSCTAASPISSGWPSTTPVMSSTSWTCSFTFGPVGDAKLSAVTIATHIAMRRRSRNSYFMYLFICTSCYTISWLKLDKNAKNNRWRGNTRQLASHIRGLVVSWLYTLIPVRRVRGLIPRSPEHIWDLILGPLHWKASSVGYALYGCNKLWSYNAV